MKYLKIQNDGELDIRLVALMGGTTKASDKTREFQQHFINLYTRQLLAGKEIEI